jgi:hypothetical protein
MTTGYEEKLPKETVHIRRAGGCGAARVIRRQKKNTSHYQRYAEQVSYGVYIEGRRFRRRCFPSSFTDVNILQPSPENRMQHEQSHIEYCHFTPLSRLPLHRIRHHATTLVFSAYQ